MPIIDKATKQWTTGRPLGLHGCTHCLVIRGLASTSLVWQDVGKFALGWVVSSILLRETRGLCLQGYASLAEREANIDLNISIESSLSTIDKRKVERIAVTSSSTNDVNRP